MLFLCLVVGLIVSIILNVFLIVFFFIQRNIANLNWKLYNDELKVARILYTNTNELLVELAKKDEMIKELEEKSQAIAEHFREYVDMIHNI